VGSLKFKNSVYDVGGGNRVSIKYTIANFMVTEGVKKIVSHFARCINTVYKGTYTEY
jgi:hypothetical protein